VLEMEIAVIDETKISFANLKIKEADEFISLELNLDNLIKVKEFSKELSDLSKEIDLKRQEYVKPALEEQKRINGIYKPAIEKLDELSRKIINRVNDFIKAEQKKEADRLAQIAKENAEKLLAGQEIQKEVVRAPELPKVTETKYWDYEIIDIKKVPMEFMTIDNVKITEAIRAGKRQIPGLQILQKTRPTRR
jgi:hypothetical protein